ncbi:hypothetical protein [Streptomyces smaragdinus]|uniref:hypothetical protein n=1 Tax=Streptomyces smaragdinus TaxID=2585196 RepID=UPI002B210BAC|nr:hypothetical protein [Streptomyces smaragdinus]
MNRQSSAALRSRYFDQAASDLEENRRLQRTLAEKIKVLEQEEVLLVDILSLAEKYEAFSDPSRLPEQTQDEHTPAPEETGGARAGGRAQPRQPLLGELLSELLSRSDEPRPAKELREELMREHPDRTPTPQVVRNTLEALVAKGRIRRHKEQRSVMYTLTEPAR